MCLKSVRSCQILPVGNRQVINMTKTDIAQILKTCRINCGLTQKEAASRLGRPQQTLASWETGKSQPDANTLFLLCDVYGVTVDQAFGFSSSGSACCRYSTILSPSTPPTDEELTIIRKLRSLTPRDRSVVLSTLDTLYQTSGGEKHYPSASAL